MQTLRTATENLSQHQLESTPARVAVMEACMSSSTPLTVEEVAHKVGSKAHLATVYRTLEKFVQLKILEKVDFQEGKFRYEYHHNHHHHAVCENCGKIEDVQDTEGELQAIEARVSAESGFTVTRHIMELFGLCNRCRQKGI